MMAIVMTSRRALLIGLGALFVGGPAIVRAASIMPVKVVKGLAPGLTPREACERLRELYQLKRRLIEQIISPPIIGDFSLTRKIICTPDMVSISPEAAAKLQPINEEIRRLDRIDILGPLFFRCSPVILTYPEIFRKVSS